MKSSYLRAGAALACAVALSACGGSDGQLYLGGQFYGVTKAGLVLTNNGGSDKAITPTSNGRGDWYFDTLIASDDRYNVQIKAEPSNVSGCRIENGSGRAGYHVYTVEVICDVRLHGLSGTVSNLKGELVLANGSDNVTLQPGATSFKLADIPEDSPYGVSILRQPANQTCTVSNGSGAVGPAPVTNVAVTCTP